MKSFTITIPSFSKAELVIFGFILASVICFVIGWWRGRDFKITGYPIPLPNHFKGCGSTVLGLILALIAVTLTVARVFFK